MRALLPQRTASALFSALLFAGVCLGQTTERVSVSSLGVEGNDATGGGYISADGRYVAFTSLADNLVFGDSNGVKDAFVHDRQTGETERVSVSSLGTEGNLASRFGTASIGASGRFVAFNSAASNLVVGDTNGVDDIFIHDRQTGETERVNVDSLGTEANSSGQFASMSIAANGRFVAFNSTASNLVPGDTNGYEDIFIHDRQTGTTERVSVDSSGAEANSYCGGASLSEDGRYVAFHTRADNLVVGDTNGEVDVFVHDRQTGITERVSIDSSGTLQGSDSSLGPRISADGRFVAFSSYATRLVHGDTNRDWDAFVHDRHTGVTERVSVNSRGNEGHKASRVFSISANGRYVGFRSLSNNLVHGDTNKNEDAFVHDRQTGVTERVSVNSSGLQGNGYSSVTSISADGRYVAIGSRSDNLVAGDTNGVGDVFVHDRWDGLGANSIYLNGPATASVGFPLELFWVTARPDSEYALAYSMNTNQSSFRGHSVDIGTPQTLLAVGINSRGGFGRYTSAPVPISAAGLTVYFEVVARDASGVIYDSNVVGVTFQ
jgi:WD40 repeat protein